MTDLRVEIENIGGIDRSELRLHEGVTLITGPNASNKTSLLKALAFAIGRDTVPLRAGTNAGYVALEFGETSVERRVERDGTTTTTDGTSLLEASETASDVSGLAAFVTLLEFNPLRTAVRTDESIEELLKAPVDIDELERKQRRAIERKGDVTERIESLSGASDRLAERQAELESLRETEAELEAELESLRSRRSDAPDEGDGELASLREKRASVTARREGIAADIGELEEAIDHLDTRYETAREDVNAAEATLDEYAADELRAERRDLRERMDDVDERIETLQTLLTANREMLDAEFEPTDRERSLTGDQQRCWTCGSTVTTDEFEDTLEDVQEMLREERERRREWEPRLEEIEDKLDDYRRAEREYNRARERKRELEETLAQRRNSLQTKQETLSEITDELSELEREIEERHRERTESDDELGDKIESTQRDLYTTRSDIDDMTTTIEQLRDDVRQLSELREEREELQDKIETLTDRIERTEQGLRESFNDAMAELMDVLAFESIERVWLDGDFELVIAREVDGTIHQSPVTHLSESERESIGLVFGLAGYLAYDLDETVPLLLLDSMGAFDIERLEALIEFFAARARYLLVAVYPELGEELPFPTYAVAETPAVSDG